MGQRVLNGVTTSGATQTITSNKIFNALLRANGNIEPFVGAVNVNRVDLGLANTNPRIIFENDTSVWFNECTSVGTLRWATPGNERITVSSVGNMGIGIVAGTAANAKLQIAGGVAITSSTAVASDPGAGNLSVAGRTATGGLKVGARIVTANTTITTAGCLLYIDALATAIDLTLPTAIGNFGTLFILIRTDNSANIVRVLTSITGQTINNSSAPFTISGNASFNFSSNDVNWFVF